MSIPPLRVSSSLGSSASSAIMFPPYIDSQTSHLGVSLCKVREFILGFIDYEALIGYNYSVNKVT